MPYRVSEANKGTIVKESGLDCEITQRRSPEFINVGLIFRDVEVAEVLVAIFGKLAAAIAERHIAGPSAKLGGDLRNARNVIFEIAKQFVRAASDGVTLHAVRFIEEKQSPALLRIGHRPRFPADKTIDRRIHKSDRELKLGDGLAEHCECDRLVVLKFGERFFERRAAGLVRVYPTDDDIADWFVAELIKTPIRTQDAHRRWQGYTGPPDGRDIKLAKIDNWVSRATLSAAARKHADR